MYLPGKITLSNYPLYTLTYLTSLSRFQDFLPKSVSLLARILLFLSFPSPRFESNNNFVANLCIIV